MSKILEVAQAFEKKSKEETQIISETVKNAIKQQEIDLIAQFQEGNKNLLNAIQTEQMKFKAKLRKIFSYTSITILTVLAMIVLVLMVWGAIEYRKMNEWKQSAENYKQISNQLKINRCTISDNKSQYCIEVDPNYKNKYWGENGSLAVLPIAVEK